MKIYTLTIIHTVTHKFHIPKFQTQVDRGVRSHTADSLQYSINTEIKQILVKKAAFKLNDWSPCFHYSERAELSLLIVLPYLELVNNARYEMLMPRKTCFSDAITILLQ